MGRVQTAKDLHDALKRIADLLGIQSETLDLDEIVSEVGVNVEIASTVIKAAPFRMPYVEVVAHLQARANLAAGVCRTDSDAVTIARLQGRIEGIASCLGGGDRGASMRALIEVPDAR